MSNLLDTLHWLPPARIFLPILLDAGLKSVAVLAVAGLAVACMKRRSAAARYLVCFLAVASLPVLPVLSWTLPGWRVLPAWMDLREPPRASLPSTRSIPPALPTPPTPSTTPSEIPPGPRQFAAAPRAIPEMAPPAQLPSAQVQIAAAPQPSPPRAKLDGWRAGMLAWLAGVLLALTPVFLGVFSLHRLEQAARRETAVSWLDLLRQLLTRLSFKRRVVLLKAARRRMPMTWGVLRPKVLLPEESREWPEARRGVVLLHELAHAKRCDYLTHLVARMVCALYWFNPLVWLAARQMVAERERACDDIVLRHGAQPADYAEQLLEISAGLSPGWFAASGGIAMARPSNLESRLVAILDCKRNRAALTRGAALASLALLAALVVPVAMLKAAPSERPAAVAEARTNSGLPASSVAERIQRLIQGAPATTNRAAEIWERAPGTRGEYKVRPEVTQYYYYNTDDSKFLACVILHLPAQNRFYIQWEDLASPGTRYYGPFEGDPFRVLAPASPASAQKPEASQPRQGQLTDPKRVDADNPLGLDDETIIRFFRTGKALQRIAMQAGPPAPLAARLPRPASTADLYKSDINREELGKDPFGNGDVRLEFSETNGRTLIRVFSVGPDGVWDGGKPILGPDLRGDLGVEIEAGKTEVRWLAEGAVLDYLKGTHTARYLAGKGTPASQPPAPPLAADEKLKFGPVVDGLRAAVELTTASGAFVLGEQIDVRFHVQNAADHDIQIAGPDWRQGDVMVLEAENGGRVLDKYGRPASVNTMWYSGWSPAQRQMLRPGQTAVLKSSSLEFLPEASTNRPANPVGEYTSVPPGKYKVHFKLEFSSSNAQLMDWQGFLETGPVLIEMKAAQAHAEESRSSQTGEGPAANPQSDWGDPVEGVSAQLRTDKTFFELPKIPYFKARVRNNGTETLSVAQTQQPGELEVDGLWYTWSYESNSVARSPLAAGAESGDIMVNAGLSWVQGLRPLVVGPGRHKFRFAVVVQRAGSNRAADIRAVSNPVEVELQWPPGTIATVAPQTKGAATVIVHGSVVDAESRQPINSFTVTPGYAGGADPDLLLWAKAQTTHGQDGAYRVELWTDASSALVLVEADGYAPEMMTVGTNTIRDFALRKSNGLMRKLVDTNGQPVFGAEVAYGLQYGLLTLGAGNLRRNGTVINTYPHRSPITSSDREGNFSLPATAGAVTLVAIHRELGFAQVPIEQAEKAAAIQLRPWARVAGTLLLGGKPLTNEIVGLKLKDPLLRGLVLSEIEHQTTTDAAGRFVFEQLPPGDCTLFRQLGGRYRANGFRNNVPIGWIFVTNGQPIQQVRFPTSAIKTEAGKTTTVELDAALQEPISDETNAGASSAHSPGSQADENASSNPPSSAGPTAGRQSVWGDPVEGVSVRLSAEGAVWDFRQQGFFKFSVRNQGRLPVAVWRTEAEGELEMDGIWHQWSQPIDAKSSVLRPGGQFDGLALSMGGEWRKDANMLPAVAGKHTLRFAIPAQLESGGARIRVVSNPLEVEFRWPAGATNLPDTFISGGLPEMARIEGRVVDDETGAAVTNFTPQMGMANQAKPGEITWSLNLSGGPMLGGEGRFRLQGQKAGQVWRILADGYLPQMVLEQPLAGTVQTTSLVVRLKRGGELRGVVVNHAGQPVPGARAAVHRVEGSSVYDVFPNMRGVGDTSATTDAAGRFVLRGVDGAAQTVVVVTSSDGQMVQPALHSALGQEMKITLPRPATLIVRYDIPGDTDQAELSLQLATRDKDMPLWNEVAVKQEATMANRGQIALTNLTPGTYEFSRQRTVQAGVWQVWPSDRRTVVLEPGQTQQLNLIRSTGQRLRGEVTGLDKTTATNGCIFIRSENGTNAMSWVGQCFDTQIFSKDGLFQTALLEPGVYSVMAEVYEPEVFTGIVTSGIRLPDYIGMAKVTVTTNAAPPPVKLELRPRVDPAKAP